ncbi:MAG: 4-hydroxybenzoate solanesyltransferase [Leptolyngbyaceae bacterium]|nr:4-hydroxybenzoate solanesyltransferase [Leptolyngbyaceae bacterium]
MVTQTPPTSEPTWPAVMRLLRWDKPTGRLILMIPALWAIFLAAHSQTAGQWPDFLLIGVIILGSITTSAAGCVINDLWDRNIDPNVARTRDRPLAARALTVKTGMVVALVALGCAAGLALYLTPLSFWLCVAAVPVIVLYPLAKRVFPVPQLVLSIAWGFAVLISWTAVTAALTPPIWLLWGAVVMWTMGFDTVYAMADREDDLKVGVNSSALFFGKWAAEAVLAFFVATAVLLAQVGVSLELTLWYWLGLGGAIALWGWQYWRLRPQHLPRTVFSQIFSQNVWIGFLLLGGMIAGSR